MVSITWIVKPCIKAKIQSIEIIDLIIQNYDNYSAYNTIGLIKAIKNRKFTIFLDFQQKMENLGKFCKNLNGLGCSEWIVKVNDRIWNCNLLNLLCLWF